MSDIKLEITGKSSDVENSYELAASFDRGDHLLLWFVSHV